MRHPLHVTVDVPALDPAEPGPDEPRARHRRPRVRTARAAWAAVPAAGRLVLGLGAAGICAATALTALVDPAAPAAPDRVPTGRSSNLAQVSGL
ncbi:hypothetical protein ACN20G_18350 [Streptomyces sp. BI20]|uniref:hypothetical protein n=1 Tax=Streptomyces sp. BI20 TaxID=3403460 RepID=UPI003C7363B5